MYKEPSTERVNNFREIALRVHGRKRKEFLLTEEENKILKEAIIKIREGRKILWQ